MDYKVKLRFLLLLKALLNDPQTDSRYLGEIEDILEYLEESVIAQS